MSNNVVHDVLEVLMVGRTIAVRNARSVPAIARPLRDAVDLVGGCEVDLSASAVPVGGEAAGCCRPALAGADAHERGGQRSRGRRGQAVLERSVLTQ